MGRVVVTGGAGFVGSALVRLLLERHEEVVVLDNLVTGRRANLAGLDVRIEVTDLRDCPLSRLLRGVDVVYHLACLGVRHSLHSPTENHEVNAGATLRLLEAARRAGVPRFVHTSSSEVYGTARTVPMTEDHPTQPHTVYGASKLAGEGYARIYHDLYGLPTVVIRPFNAFGPRSHHEGDSGEVIPRFVVQAMTGCPLTVFGDGWQTRDLTYVEDTAQALFLAGVTDAAIGRTINVGSGRETSVSELAHVVSQALGVETRIDFQAARPGDVRRLCCDSSRALEVLGWTPSVGLRRGVQHLCDWYRDSPPLPEERADLRAWETHGTGPRRPAAAGSA